jgi:hypothetical protein
MEGNVDSKDGRGTRGINRVGMLYKYASYSFRDPTHDNISGVSGRVLSDVFLVTIKPFVVL